jgi:hypothetical protein
MLSCVNISEFKNNHLIYEHGYTLNYIEKENIFLIFGGLNFNQSKELNNFEFSNSLIECNISKKSFEFVKINSKPPPHRNFHTCINYNQSLIIFGGKSTGYLNDVHEYSIGI